MTDPFTKTRFRSDLKLETWFPEGTLDITLATVMAHYIGFEESIADEPFNRYTDFSKLTAIHLVFAEIASIAAERRASYRDGEPVKSAILAINSPAYGVAHLFAALMEESPIEVKVFRKREDAARWLEVPVEALVEDP